MRKGPAPHLDSQSLSPLKDTLNDRDVTTLTSVNQVVGAVFRIIGRTLLETGWSTYPLVNLVLRLIKRKQFVIRPISFVFSFAVQI